MAFNKKWVEENKEIVLELVSLYDKTIKYFYDPKNKEEIVNILIAKIKITKEEATKSYELYFDNKYFTVGNYKPKDKFKELMHLFQKYE